MVHVYIHISFVSCIVCLYNLLNGLSADWTLIKCILTTANSTQAPMPARQADGIDLIVHTNFTLIHKKVVRVPLPTIVLGGHRLVRVVIVHRLILHHRAIDPFTLNHLLIITNEITHFCLI